MDTIKYIALDVHVTCIVIVVMKGPGSDSARAAPRWFHAYSTSTSHWERSYGLVWYNALAEARR